MRIIDLSVAIDERAEPMGVAITRPSHAETAAGMAGLFGARVEDLPGGLGWGIEQVTLSAHVGTHVDAPWHYFPTTNGGERARSIDELPLEWFYGPGVRLDMQHKGPGARILPDDLEQALAGIGYALQPGDIVVIQTGADKLWGAPAIEGKSYPPPVPPQGQEYFAAGCGMSREGTLWLIERGIKVMGTDAWGWDPPFWKVRQDYQRNADPRVIWEAHRVGIEREYCQIEKLANLDQLPGSTGFTVCCFPVKLAGGSGGWCRAVAIVPD